MNDSPHSALVRDPVLAPWIPQAGNLTPVPRRLSTFDSLAFAIIHQQISGTAAKAILARFHTRFGSPPSPSLVRSASAEELRAIGLSRSKGVYLQGLAAACLNGELPDLQQADQMGDSDILRALTALRGIGRWSVEMFLIFNLGRPDVLPAHDLGIRRGFQIATASKKPPAPAWLEQRGQKWKPFRSSAALLLWRIADGPAAGEW